VQHMNICLHTQSQKRDKNIYDPNVDKKVGSMNLLPNLGPIWNLLCECMRTQMVHSIL
jgi:hypothetical protein